MRSESERTTVLVLGSTGQVGKLVVKALTSAGNVDVRVSSRRKDEVHRLRSEGKNAVHLDLDDPRTFGLALAGVDRLFVLTGYSVAMLAQTKTLVDAAKKAGVAHIVHLGVFAESDCTDPHFAWHQLVETYIEASGIAWTHLHPNMFMENLLSFTAPRGDVLTVYWGPHRMGWIAAADIASVAATVLKEGPHKHASRNYWLSTEALDAAETATILGEVTGREIRPEICGAEEFKKLFTSSSIPVESWYAEGGVEFMRQVIDGRMGYISSVRDDVPHVTGKAAITFREWALQNRDALVALARTAR